MPKNGDQSQRKSNHQQDFRNMLIRESECSALQTRSGEQRPQYGRQQPQTVSTERDAELGKQNKSQ